MKPGALLLIARNVASGPSFLNFSCTRLTIAAASSRVPNGAARSGSADVPKITVTKKKTTARRIANPSPSTSGTTKRAQRPAVHLIDKDSANVWKRPRAPSAPAPDTQLFVAPAIRRQLGHVGRLP